MFKSINIKESSIVKKIGGIVFTILSIISLTMMYNSLSDLKHDVESAESKIEVQLQRRHELIPNVLESVKGYMSHEKDILKDIETAHVNVGNSDSKTEQSNLDTAISRFLVVTKTYPELKADGQISKLITELEGTENRIAISRKDYNEVATLYNKKISRFPVSIVAKFTGHKKVELYQSDKGAEKAPSVKFND